MAKFELGQTHFDVLKTFDAAGFRQAPAHYAQDENLEQRHLLWFPLIPSSSSGNCFFVLKLSSFRKTQVAAQPHPRVSQSQTTWHFNFTQALLLPAFTSAEDVCLVFLAILIDVQDNQSLPG